MIYNNGMVSRAFRGIVVRVLRFILVVVFFPFASVKAADYVWIEAEALAKPPAGFKSAGPGNKQYLSGETWLSANIDGKDAEALPAGGVVLSFPFTSTQVGDHNVWGRIGYEFARSPFLWRVDAGEWSAFGPEKLTTDLMNLAEWTEVAWAQLGQAKLAPGRHVLEIKFERRVLPNKSQPERILAGFDCFCLTPLTFLPNGPHKPDSDWKTDIDRTAERSVLQAGKQSGPRTQFALNGVWQVARWDEQEIKDRDQPAKELPADIKSLFWKGIAVPGNRDTARPDLLYCHRFLYRTKLQMGGQAGQTAILRFPSTAMLASVFVNGLFCGGNDTPGTAWEADVTSALKFGAENELIVAIKDCYYALETDGEGKSPRFLFNYPTEWFYTKGGLGPTRFADFPVLVQVQGAGIFETPELIVSDGPVRIADVFAKPSVSKKELDLEITLHNSSGKPVKVTVSNEIIGDPLKRVTTNKTTNNTTNYVVSIDPLQQVAATEKTFAVKEVEVPANGDITIDLVEKWENPHLWWPDEPQQYEVSTKVSLGDKTVDSQKTKFGFREWGWTGQAITLNGIPWHFRADLLHNGDLARKRSGQSGRRLEKGGNQYGPLLGLSSLGRQYAAGSIGLVRQDRHGDPPHRHLRRRGCIIPARRAKRRQIRRPQSAIRSLDQAADGHG